MKKILIILTIAILILSYENVKASTISSDGIANGYWYFSSEDNYLTSEQSSYTWVQYSNDNLQRKRLTFTQYVPSASSDYVEFNVLFSQPIQTATTSSETARYCTRWDCMQYCATGNCAGMCEQYNCISYSSYTTGTDTTVYSNGFTDMQVLPIITYHEGGWASCSMNGNTITCPTNGKNIDFIDFDILFKTSTTTNLKVSVSRTINFYKSSTSSIIDNQNQNTQEILNQNATYTDTPTTDYTNQTQEINEYTNEENQLMNSLDFNMSVLDGITINPNASGFIWNIVDRLRTINPAIILLMTSILGMGIIKMVLNR